MGKTNALNEDDLAEFVSLQETKADSDNSWTVKVSDLNANSYDLTVKNPNKVEVIENSDMDAIVSQPKWFTNQKGIGTQIQSKKGNIRLKIRCINNGKLNVTLRGIDFRDDYDNRIPIYVKYTKLMIDDENVIENPAFIWHDEPLSHEIDVEDGQTVDILVEWGAV